MGVNSLGDGDEYIDEYIGDEYIDTTIRRDERGRAETMAMLPPPPTNPQPCPNSAVLAGERKK